MKAGQDEASAGRDGRGLATLSPVSLTTIVVVLTDALVPAPPLDKGLESACYLRGGCATLSR